jgi:hypothetical protein
MRANRMPKCRKYVDTEATHNVRPAHIRHANVDELGEWPRYQQLTPEQGPLFG